MQQGFWIKLDKQTLQHAIDRMDNDPLSMDATIGLKITDGVAKVYSTHINVDKIWFMTSDGPKYTDILAENILNPKE